MMEKNYGKTFEETPWFSPNDEIDSWGGLDDDDSVYFNWSSLDLASTSVPKNIVLERNRRKKLNEQMFALRAVVPIITDMKKASIIKDAITYIQDLKEQESTLRKVIESCNLSPKTLHNRKSQSTLRKKRTEQTAYSSAIKVLELQMICMGERTLLVSLICLKEEDTMVKLCEVFELLNLKIKKADIFTLPGKLVKSIFVEADVEEQYQLKILIERALMP